jgi:hypothetical protein
LSASGAGSKPKWSRKPCRQIAAACGCLWLIPSRPPIVTERLSLTNDGHVLYRLKNRWRDGSTHVLFEPLTFLERLCALVPRPRLPLVTYHGVLAPAAADRAAVVPDPPERSPARCHTPPSTRGVPAKKPRRGRPWHPWADLIKRVFAVDVLVCPFCRGRRRVLAFLTDPSVIRKILECLRLPTDAPPIAPARPPPEAQLSLA